MLTPASFFASRTATVALSPSEPETLAAAAVILASVLRSALRSSVSAVVMAEFATATWVPLASLLPEEAVTPEASMLSTPVSLLWRVSLTTLLLAVVSSVVAVFWASRAVLAFCSTAAVSKEAPLLSLLP